MQNYNWVDGVLESKRNNGNERQRLRQLEVVHATHKQQWKEKVITEQHTPDQVKSH